MKTFLLLISIILIGEKSNSQIILENSYPATSGIVNASIVNLANSGYKYTITDYKNNNIKLYNMNHSLWKTIQLSVPVGFTLSTINAISETLFNTDGLIELIYSYTKYSPTINFESKIINENGSVLMTIPNCQLAYPVNTGSNGWKLISRIDSVNSFADAFTEIYSLVGYIPQVSVKEEIYQERFISTPFPNPSYEAVTINYQLPNDVSSAEIVIYSLNGNALKHYNVDKSFNSLKLDNSDLPAGTYLYDLITPNSSFTAKKMIVIK